MRNCLMFRMFALVRFVAVIIDREFEEPIAHKKCIDVIANHATRASALCKLTNLVTSPSSIERICKRGGRVLRADTYLNICCLSELQGLR